MPEAFALEPHSPSLIAFPLLAAILFLFFVSASVPSPLFVDWRLDPHQDEDGFRHAAVAYFDGNEAVYDLKAQLWADAEKQPIEDVSVDWPVEITPYLAVATVSLPRQAAYAPERVRYFDEVMTFRPAHSLAAHKALGSVMRARLQVYAALSASTIARTAWRRRSPPLPNKFPPDQERNHARAALSPRPDAAGCAGSA